MINCVCASCRSTMMHGFKWRTQLQERFAAADCDATLDEELVTHWISQRVHMFNSQSLLYAETCTFDIGEQIKSHYM